MNIDFEKSIMFLLLIFIIVPCIVFPLIILENNTKYHYPYANLPIVILEKNISEKNHRRNLENLIAKNKYYSLISYIIINNLPSRFIFKYLIEDDRYKKFNNMTNRNGLFTLFTSQHLFGLYGIRFNLWKGNTLIDSQQLFTKELFSDKMTNGFFTSRYWQVTIYTISNIINRYGRTGDLSEDHIRVLQNILNHYLKINGSDVERISLQVSPIYDKKKYEEIIWSTFCDGFVINKKIVGTIKCYNQDSHPFNSIGVKELKGKYTLHLKYD